MNDKELHAKVNAAAYKLMRASGIVSPVEVLMEIGILSKADYECWRKGQLDYLERCPSALAGTANQNSRVMCTKKLP